MCRRHTITSNIPSSWTASGRKDRFWRRSSTTFDTAERTVTPCTATCHVNASPSASSSTITWATVPSSTGMSTSTTWWGTTGKSNSRYSFNVNYGTVPPIHLNRHPLVGLLLYSNKSIMTNAHISVRNQSTCRHVSSANCHFWTIFLLRVSFIERQYSFYLKSCFIVIP